MRRISQTLVLVVATSACGQEPSTCPENLSIDISNAVLAVYNGGIATGTFTCPAGGGGSVTGTRGTNNYDYTIMYNACINTGTESMLTLTGTIHDTTNTSTHVETADADALHITGSETACTADPIDAMCAVHFSFTGQDSSGVPIGTGSVCGLTFP